MQRMRLDKKRKSTTTRKKRPLLKINSQCLELLIKENSGNSSKYCVIIPGISEPPVRTLRATIPENERHIFR